MPSPPRFPINFDENDANICCRNDARRGVNILKEGEPKMPFLTFLTFPRLLPETRLRLTVVRLGDININLVCFICTRFTARLTLCPLHYKINVALTLHLVHQRQVTSSAKCETEQTEIGNASIENCICALIRLDRNCCGNIFTGSEPWHTTSQKYYKFTLFNLIMTR